MDARVKPAHGNLMWVSTGRQCFGNSFPRRTSIAAMLRDFALVWRI
jgi:hypothetical protein